MGDYSIKVSYSLDGSPRVFLGDISFNGNAILSGRGECNGGEMKEEREIRGNLKLNNEGVMLNFLKMPVIGEDFDAIEFQILKGYAAERIFPGTYTGAWRLRRNIHRPPNSNIFHHLWEKEFLPNEVWINQRLIEEKKVLAELSSIPEISLEQNLNTSLSI